MDNEENIKELQFFKDFLKMGIPREGDSVCFYCGCPAQEREHTVPLGFLKALIELKMVKPDTEIPKQKIVDTCYECNRLPRMKEYLGTPIMRKKNVKEELKKKYKKLLKTPDWTDKELIEMDTRMREYILTFLHAKKLTQKRIAY